MPTLPHTSVCRLFAVLAAFVILLGGSVSSFGQSEKALEYRVKAAFVVHLTKYVTWPDEAVQGKAAFRIGVLGKNPFNGELAKAISGQTASGLEMKLLVGETLEEVKDCHIIFVAAGGTSKRAAVFEQLGRLPALTVGDTQGFAKAGGMIEMYRKGEKVRMKVNLNKAKTNGFKVSSNLLRLVEIVKTAK